MSLYGVRLFAWQGDRIHSPLKRVEWYNRILRAECIDNTIIPDNHTDPAPSEFCTCGFYANWTIPHLLDCANRDSGSFALYFSNPFVVGIVEAYGKIVVCEDGYRAEYMRIIGFIPFTAEARDSRTGTPAKLFGFPIVQHTRELVLNPNEKVIETLCKSINVALMDMDSANYLLETSEQEYK